VTLGAKENVISVTRRDGDKIPITKRNANERAAWLSQPKCMAFPYQRPATDLARKST
jgi:hypothetical protein